MVKDHSDTERKPAATTLWAVLSYYQKGILYMHHLTEMKAPVVELWLNRELAEWFH